MCPHPHRRRRRGQSPRPAWQASGRGRVPPGESRLADRLHDDVKAWKAMRPDMLLRPLLTARLPRIRASRARRASRPLRPRSRRLPSSCFASIACRAASSSPAGSRHAREYRARFLRLRRSHPVPSPRCPVSIICVFNDARVREQCLDSSIERHRSEVDDLDYVVVDNRDGAFASAGAAFNFGASRARHDHLVFVHQDVVLHSLTALEHAAAILEADQGIGLVGAIGVERGGRLVGRVRDRGVLIGEHTDGPVDVDSIDEVLFIVPRRVFDRERLSEAPKFAWHAYAVEYGLRLRQTGCVRAPSTCRSPTTACRSTSSSLDSAYDELARAYPGALPVRTPSRIVTRRRARPPPGAD